jgi:hypothetical protein
MEQATMQTQQDDGVYVFDERGGLIGTIPHPQSGEPIGAGREKVYLKKATQEPRSAAA